MVLAVPVPPIATPLDATIVPVDVVIPLTPRLPAMVGLFSIFAPVMTSFAILFVVTVPSVGVPTLRTSPNAIMKSIESDDVNALENVICEPEIVNDTQVFE